MNRYYLALPVLIVLLLLPACDPPLVPEAELEGLTRPQISAVYPGTVLLNNAGFLFRVYAAERLEHDAYALYINDRLIGDARPDYWRRQLGWFLSGEQLRDLMASPSGGDRDSLSIRISSIVGYDLSGVLWAYPDYVSNALSMRVARGETDFSEPRLLFPEWNTSDQPLIRSDPRGYLYLAWLERLGDFRQAFFSHSADGGHAWSQVLNISRSAGDVQNIDLAVDSRGFFYLAWNENVTRSGNSYSSADVFFSRSLDNGATWHDPRRLNQAGETALNPVIDVDEPGTVRLAWKSGLAAEPERLCLLVSRDLGLDWERWEVAPPRDFSHSYWLPVLASGRDGFLCLAAFQSTEGFHFFYSLDHGSSWQSEFVPTGKYFFIDPFPVARCGPEGRVYLTWAFESYTGHTYGNQSNFLRGSAGGGWSQVQELNQHAPVSGTKIAQSVRPDGRLDMVLKSSTSLFLLRSADEGISWSWPEFIPGTDSRDFSPRSPDLAIHPEGLNFLVFTAWTGTGRSIFLMSFN